ncbi:OsmC family protein [Kaarinaea lacus]
MSNRKFQFRLSSQYKSEKNDVSKLLFEHLVDSEWQEYDPTNYAAGFLVLLYALFNCQHLYFRVNAAERGLQLKSARGTLDVETNKDWEIQKFHIHFEGLLNSGVPGKDDEDFIVERLAHCPVSVNIKPIADMQASIRFE